MIEVKSEGIILESSRNAFDDQAVLNPACVEIDGVGEGYVNLNQGAESTTSYLLARLAII
ncbi:MAG: hypothetical protein KKC66_01610 [Candidatus Omnitrophica bacterium]|nr:hypothetical protein [Candidatus Omnitrophota bacterium]MBU1932585.1 hypothetical protein [Candidatus Omnitrophota bacterium]